MTKSSRPLLFYFPGSPVLNNAGSQARAKWLLQSLGENFSRITFYSYAQGPSWPWTESSVARFADQFPEIALIIEDDSITLRTVKSIKNMLLSLFPRATKEILDISVPLLTPKLKDYFRQNGDTIVICSFVDGLTQLNGLGSKSYFVDMHDIKFVHYLKLANSAVTDIKVMRKFRGEMAVLSHSTGVVAISPAEEAFLRMVLADTPIYFLPATPSPLDLPEPARYTYDMVFVGSGVELNKEGLKSFILEHDGWLRSRRLAVCGPICRDQAVRDLCSARNYVTLLGEVPDLNPVFSVTKCAISPVDGSGLKIKVVDALARGLPVFASRQSFDGLVPGFEQCVFPINQQGMQCILDDQQALSAAKSAARAYYERFRKSGDFEKFVRHLKFYKK